MGGFLGPFSCSLWNRKTVKGEFTAIAVEHVKFYMRNRIVLTLAFLTESRNCFPTCGIRCRNGGSVAFLCHFVQSRPLL